MFKYADLFLFERVSPSVYVNRDGGYVTAVVGDGEFREKTSVFVLGLSGEVEGWAR